MSAFIAAIEPLVDELATFVSDLHCKLLHVRVGVELRSAAIELVRAHEHRLDNPSPFVVLEQDHTARSPGWAARVEAARMQHDVRRDGAVPPIPELPPTPTARDERVCFALQVRQLSDAAPVGAEGLVVVLAPRVLEAPERWCETVDLLVVGRDLAAVRWIVVEVETTTLDSLVASLGSKARQIDVRVSMADTIATLERLANRPTGAGPKGVTPPKRKDVPGSEDAVGLRRVELGRLVLSAALAASRGRSVEAIDAQRRARDICESAGWLDESIAMELVLGGHLVAAGAVREAEAGFLRAIESARKHDRTDKIATAGFGLGAARTIRGERHTALVAYAEAALAAEDSGSSQLAIEGSRLAGQAALDLRMEPQAITFFGRAVRLAEQSVEDVSSSSAAIAARSLAAVCRKRRMPERAVELDAQAQRFARPRTDAIVAGTPGTEQVADEGASSLPGAARQLVPFATPEPSSTPIASPVQRHAAIEVAQVAAAASHEPTSLLTLEEIARVHWGGVVDDPSPPAEGSRSWTHEEICVLQHAVDHSLDAETSTMLTRDELAALRGQSVAAVSNEPEPPSLDGPQPPDFVVPDEPRPVDRLWQPAAMPAAAARMVDDAAVSAADPTAARSIDVVGTGVPEKEALQDALARMLAFGEGRMVMRRDELDMIRKHLLSDREADADEDDSEDPV